MMAMTSTNMPTPTPTPTASVAVEALADALATHGAVAGLVFELPRARVPFGTHRGRDITARAGRQWRGEPLDEGDDLGRPPFVPLEARPAEEREFILQYLDMRVARRNQPASRVGRRSLTYHPAAPQFPSRQRFILLARRYADRCDGGGPVAYITEFREAAEELARG